MSEPGPHRKQIATILTGALRSDFLRQELIKVRGFQVAPPELEAVLLSHPMVLDAAVIGVPAVSAVDGESPRAYVVVGQKDSSSSSLSPSVTEAELREYVASRVAKYKALNGGIAFVDELPKTASGKYLKRYLREQYAKGEARDDGKRRTARL